MIRLSKTEEERATELAEKLISVDLHTISINPFSEDEYGGRAYPRDRVRNSNLTCLLETIENGRNPHQFDALTGTVWSYVDFFTKQEGMTVAYCGDDIRDVKKNGDQAAMISIEMEASIYPSLDRIDILHKLGVRRFDPILNYRNYLGDGCLERYDSGLSYFGLAFVERMSKVGMIIDLSHWGEKSSFDAIEASKDPVIISHSGARALLPRNKRLKSDELIKTLAEKDGLIGVTAIPNYLSQEKRQGVKDMINHIDYIVNLVGVDYVAIGTDIIWGDQMALPITLHHLHAMGLEVAAKYMEGIDTIEEWPNITRALVSRGYSDLEVEKIIGGNALRTIDKVIK